MAVRADSLALSMISAWQRCVGTLHRISAALTRAARRLQKGIRWFLEYCGVQLRTKAVAIKNAGQLVTRRAHSEILLFPFRFKSYLRLRRDIYFRIFATLLIVLELIACRVAMGRWAIVSQYCAHLNPTVFGQMAVALGTSISGLLAIVFALTTFAIQQVAGRESAEIVQEYAGDRRMASTYWILAWIAVVGFALSFAYPVQDFLPTQAITFFVLLMIAFLLIYRHFKIVMLYSDPRFTVDRLRQRGLRELRGIARTVDRARRATERNSDL